MELRTSLNLEFSPAWEGTHPSWASRRLGGAAADIPAVVDDNLSSELPVTSNKPGSYLGLIMS